MAKLTYNSSERAWYITDSQFVPKGFEMQYKGCYKTTKTFDAIKHREYANVAALKQIEVFLNNLLNIETKELSPQEFFQIREGRNWQEYDRLHPVDKLVHRAREVMYYKGKISSNPNNVSLLKSAKLPLIPQKEQSKL